MKKMIVLMFLMTSLLCKSQPRLNVTWSERLMISRSTATLQVVGNPMLRPQAPMRQGSLNALRALGADYVRYVPWFPYPKLAVAELEPPTSTSTSWDFTLIDPMTSDFFEYTKGHSIIFNFSTIPQWMFKTPEKVQYPADPNQVAWGYAGGRELRDTTMKELTDYYVRLISWYTKGGFVDELGKFHKSGHNYKIPYLEILNEPDLEHSMSVQMYTRIYDAMVTALRPILPGTQFMGLAIAYTGGKAGWFEYFLNPANHKSGIPLDWISYHCYANANSQQKFDAYEYSVFDKAESFINTVGYIENIRKRVAPATRTDINELGTFVSEEMRNQPIPTTYWNLSASVYAYFFIELTKLGIDVIGESQLVGFPTQFPDVSLINYQTNQPNARYWVLKLIKDNLPPGTELVKTDIDANTGDDILAQAFIDRGVKKLLILNKRNKPVNMKLSAECNGAVIYRIDSVSADREATKSLVSNEITELNPFAVNLIVLPKNPPMISN